ncbi:M3 family oligoendopeptidase [Pseudovibrio sp. Tun.PSC04-5.I4]|uniref:M3 family oligoendopeptidase n=1 Tax=Pseudovibrio sp. Tun.PSC04-5.I4 TaxID=1798213 RepID=UPI000881F3BA|nr:M3 family oligoendopeptidase [Pseudovibrio sp. Tun.PSC04-5.I4]SDR32285.1 oligoendopeptidase F [Pseudovibrio sp. Tun.PSC04-5.I4]
MNVKHAFPFSAAFQNAEATAASSSLGDLPEWDLSVFYSSMDAPEIDVDMVKAKDLAEQFETEFKGKLAEIAGRSGDELAGIISRYEVIEDLMGRIGSFAGLTYTGDTTDPARQKFYGDVQEKLTTASLHLLFFTLEMNKIEDAVLDNALASEKLAYFRPWLEELRKERPHERSEEIEQLFHEKHVTGAAAWNRLFDETISGSRYEIDGEELSIEQTLNLLQDSDGENRSKAAAALSKTFAKNLSVFTLITNTLAKDKDTYDRWHNFDDIADSRHLANRVERDVVDALVDAVRDAYPRLSHRYYAMKAKWLGVEKMHFWDRNAPLPQADNREIPWEEAKSTVLNAYSKFSPELSGIAEQFFDKNWIDAPARPGKSPGAFAHPTVPSAHPFVLVNYQGKIRDVMTLAHELGHGVHQVLAAPNGALMAPTPLTLAETASVFGEMLTFKDLLANAETPEKRQIMIAGKVEDMLNTVVRQIAFYTFERQVHELRKEGELTAEQLSAIWMGIQEESLGDAIDLEGGYENYWTYIPHFIHSPFYVYAYAFGDCLVNSLYAVYEEAEEGFQQKYFDLLKAGGTKHHSELLAPFGLDATDPAFWQKGLAVIERLIDELEEMDNAG